MPFVLAGTASGVQPAGAGVAARAEQQGRQHRQPAAVAACRPAHAPRRRLHRHNRHRPPPAQHQPPAGGAAAMLVTSGLGKLLARLICLGAAPVVIQCGSCRAPAAVSLYRIACRRWRSRCRGAPSNSSTRAMGAAPPAWRRPQARLLATLAAAASTRHRSRGRPRCSMRSNSSSSRRCLTSSSGVVPEISVGTAAASAQLEQCRSSAEGHWLAGPEFVIARRCGSPVICDGTPFSSFSSAARIKESRFSSVARIKESRFSH